jgi:hypothetical protein
MSGDSQASTLIGHPAATEVLTPRGTLPSTKWGILYSSASVAENTMSKQQQNREAIIVRDLERCTCCLGPEEIVETLDVDHNVPQGAGGSDRISNKNTLCRQCHDAKHGDGIAPTVQLQSTGTMNDVEFYWFKHLLDEMLPRLADEFGVHLNPKFGLKDDNAWYLPLGDLRRLDKSLYEADDEYQSYRTEQFM